MAQVWTSQVFEKIVNELNIKGNSVAENPNHQGEQIATVNPNGVNWADIPETLKYSVRDYLSTGSELCLMGVGPLTYDATARWMIENNSFGTKRVAIVRDFFDRRWKRNVLNDVLVFLDKNTVAVDDSILGSENLKRRLVCEYVKTSNGKYVQSRLNVELGEYLSDQGLNLIRVKEDLSSKHSLLIINWGDGSLTVANQKLANELVEGGYKGNIQVLEFSNHWDLLSQSIYTNTIKPGNIEINNKNGDAEATLKLNKHTSFHWTKRSTLEGKPTQTTNTILQIVPIGFQTNEETILDNHFMKRVEEKEDEIERKALEEFSALHMRLTKAGVRVVLYCAERFHKTPDAVFPNNWFSTHPTSETGVSIVALYPMKTPTRRAERRQNIIEEMQAVYDRELTFNHWEYADIPQYLESTGVLIMDRIRKRVYVSISERASKKVAEQWAQRLGYELVSFRCVDNNKRSIYHTNVVMSVGSTLAVVCLDSVDNAEDRKNLESKLSEYHKVMDISLDQMNNFCGNIIEVQGHNGRRVMCMSATAYNNFTEAQRELMLKHVDDIVYSDIPIIETIGGGSVRCMIGEIF